MRLHDAAAELAEVVPLSAGFTASPVGIGHPVRRASVRKYTSRRANLPSGLFTNSATYFSPPTTSAAPCVTGKASISRRILSRSSAGPGISGCMGDVRCSRLNASPGLALVMISRAASRAWSNRVRSSSRRAVIA